VATKIRNPSGTHVINLNSDATVGDLLSEIRAQNTADASTDIEIKYGYPPKPLRLDHHPASTRLANLPVPLQGEQLIIALKDGRRVDNPKDMNLETELSERKSFSFISGSKSNYNNQSNSVPSSAPLSLSRHAAPKLNKDDPPDVTLKSGRGKVVLRVMEDDNSCLFQALSYVMTRSMISSEELHIFFRNH
jgi:ubiquitin thioesterase OTU1